MRGLAAVAATVPICVTIGAAAATAGARMPEDAVAPEATAPRLVDRPLLLPRRTFSLDASMRGSDGSDGAMFEYLVSAFEIGTGSGVTDIQFGMDLITSQPAETDLDVIEKMHMRLATGIGTDGIIALRFDSFKPTTAAAIKPQFLDLSVAFKRSINEDVIVIAGGGFDSAYFVYPSDRDPGVSVWMTRLYLTAKGQIQITPAIAGEAALSVYIPIAQAPAEDEPNALQLDTTAVMQLRGYYTFTRRFDAYLELVFNSKDDPRASLGETKAASLGVRGLL